MGNPDSKKENKERKKGEKRRPCISSGNENSERIQDDAFVTLKITEFQAIKGNQGQYLVSQQPRHTQGPSQLNSIRHGITKTGTA